MIRRRNVPVVVKMSWIVYGVTFNLLTTVDAFSPSARASGLRFPSTAPATLLQEESTAIIATAGSDVRDKISDAGRSDWLLENVTIVDSNGSNMVNGTPMDGIVTDSLMEEVKIEAEMAVSELVDEPCEIDPNTGKAIDEVCTDESAKDGFRQRMKAIITDTLQLVGDQGGTMEIDEAEIKDLSEGEMVQKRSLKRALAKPWKTISKKVKSYIGFGPADDIDDDKILGLAQGEILERGWEKRAQSSALVRNAEVWKFALASVFRVLKPRKMRKTGKATEAEIKAAQVEAALFIRDGLLRLGPSFVKLGQVASTRTDVLPSTYTDVLKTLTDEVPGFSGAKAKAIVSKELGQPVDKLFSQFSSEPLKAASLGQVHTAFYKGKKVAIKVQRAGLKDLFDVDLKNLKKLAVLLDKFDPKSDGADRDWVSIYEESERLLYLEIDYLNEADNAERFARDFADIEWVRVPRVYREVSTPRVLVMEFVESFKLTDIQRIEKLGLNRKLLAKQVADAFLRQVIETAYFHADPHSGNLCVNDSGSLVYYDFGQMDELKPNVRKGLRTFCKALFAGGPMISDLQLARNAKDLVKGVEEAGVLSRSADRLAVEKLARFFMRSFKDKQLGKSSGNIKETLGTDLQTLTENNSFRFPPTFTFVFRAFVSVEGIGKELDPDFDLGKLAQPFIEKFTNDEQGYKSEADRKLAIFQKATGLNYGDINTAIMQPRKIAYIEETIRAMETGSLKVRVRSLENEKALERLNLRQNVIENALLASLCFNVAGLVGQSLLRSMGVAGASFFLFQTLMANAKIKKFDKTQAKYVNADFVEAMADSEPE